MAITGAALVGNNQTLGKMPAGQLSRFTITLDNAYVAGGYASFVATTLKGVSGYENITVTDIPPQLVTFGAAWYFLRYDRANDKLQVILAATGVEAAGGAAPGSPPGGRSVSHS